MQSEDEEGGVGQDAVTAYFKILKIQHLNMVISQRIDIASIEVKTEHFASKSHPICLLS
jgi:hypothetical protein